MASLLRIWHTLSYYIIRVQIIVLKSKSPPAFDRWAVWQCTWALNESNHFRLKVENEWQRIDMWSLYLRRLKVSRSITLMRSWRLLKTQFNCWILRANITIFRAHTCTIFDGDMKPVSCFLTIWADNNFRMFRTVKIRSKGSKKLGVVCIAFN